MKRLGKILSSIVIGILTLVMCVAFSACGEKSEEGNKVYSVNVDGALASWTYNFVNIGVFGDEHWGMINIEDWGNKKLALGPDNTCVGTGCKWSVKLDVSGEQYKLYIIAHIKGNGTVYQGEGDYTYMFQGPYSSVSDGYKLEAPTYVEVSLTEGFELITEGYDFADYIPTGPWKIDSTMSDTDEFVVTNNNNSNGTKGLQDKLWPSVLVGTVFGGATFHVSGDKIVSVTDVTLPL